MNPDEIRRFWKLMRSIREPSNSFGPQERPLGASPKLPGSRSGNGLRIGPFDPDKPPKNQLRDSGSKKNVAHRICETQICCSRPQILVRPPSRNHYCRGTWTATWHGQPAISSHKEPLSDPPGGRSILPSRLPEGKASDPLRSQSNRHLPIQPGICLLPPAHSARLATSLPTSLPAQDQRLFPSRWGLESVRIMLPLIKQRIAFRGSANSAAESAVRLDTLTPTWIGHAFSTNSAIKAQRPLCFWLRIRPVQTSPHPKLVIRIGRVPGFTFTLKNHCKSPTIQTHWR